MLLDVVLHDKVVLVGVDTDICITREAEIHDVAEDAVNIRIAGNAMDDVIGQSYTSSLFLFAKIAIIPE